MEFESEDRKITINEHNKIVEYHIQQLKESEDKKEKMRTDLLHKISELEEEISKQRQTYELNTPERLRKLNAEFTMKIFDLQDIITDKDDLIELLREEIKNNNMLAETEKKQLQEKINSKIDTISELREQIKKKNILLKKYSPKK